MVDSISAGASTLQFQPGNYAKQSSGGSSKVKIDTDAAPTSKVNIDTTGNAGEGKGVKIDIKV